MSNELIALVPLPVDAELEILSSGPLALRDTLASSPFLSDPAATMLLSARRPLSQWRAIRRINDSDRLEHYIHRGSAARATAAARNPAAPAAALSSALRSDVDSVVLAALVNSSTPASDRCKIATPTTVDRLVNVGGSLGHSVIRAAEVVLHNQWMASTPERWDGATQRAIACSPDTPIPALIRLHEVSRFGGKFLRTHPLFRNESTTWDDYTTDDLLGYENPAADLQAMRREDFSLIHAKVMLSRVSHPVEPQVLARILARFGFAACSGVPQRPFSGTRIGAAQWTTPCAEFLERGPLWVAQLDEVVAAVEDLGTDRDRWSSFLTLLPTWQLSLVQLVTAAHRLNR